MGWRHGVPTRGLQVQSGETEGDMLTDESLGFMKRLIPGTLPSPEFCRDDAANRAGGS